MDQSNSLRNALGSLLDHGDFDASAFSEAEDISLLTRLKEALNAKLGLEQRLDLYFECSGVGMFDHIVDPSAVPAGHPTTTYSNLMRSMLGYDGEHDFPNEFDSFNNSLHPDDQARVNNAFGAHLMDKTGQTPFREEYRLRHKQGHYIWVRAAGGTVRDGQGNPLRACGSTFDIDQEKTALENSQGDAERMKALLGNIQSSISDARQVLSLVDTGLDTSNQVLDCVEGLNTVVSKISDLTSDIQGVAKQTNLLALNATIEAARAGEAGRGFAVVASEVKKLSSDTDKLANEVTENITKAVSGASEAAQSTEQVKQAVEQIRTASSTVLEALESLAI